jgi:prepilin-type N-terminal cleavage/methylation domain-containing protein
MTHWLMRRMSGQRGFTLPEVLVAVFVIVIGLVAVATGFQYATSGVATGRGETMATFLAQQRIEQLKTVAMTNYDPPYPGVSLAAGTTTEYCQTSNIGATSANCQSTAISGTTSYTRVTTITDNPGGTGCSGVAPLLCKRIRVSVTYRPVTSGGDLSQTRTVDVFAVVTPRS